MTIKSFAVVAAIAALPTGSTNAWSQSQTLVDAVSSETAAPAAKGDVEYLNISKALKCEDTETSCTASLNGKKGKQTLITHVSCLTIVGDGMAAFGAITASKNSPVAHAILPVASRAIDAGTEFAVVEGPTQVSLGPDDKVTLGVAAASGSLAQVICNVTGTITKL